jgi:hypothetical protein
MIKPMSNSFGNIKFSGIQKNKNKKSHEGRQVEVAASHSKFK